MITKRDDNDDDFEDLDDDASNYFTVIYFEICQ